MLLRVKCFREMGQDWKIMLKLICLEFLIRSCMIVFSLDMEKVIVFLHVIVWLIDVNGIFLRVEKTAISRVAWITENFPAEKQRRGGLGEWRKKSRYAVLPRPTGKNGGSQEQKCQWTFDWFGGEGNVSCFLNHFWIFSNKKIRKGEWISSKSKFIVWKKQKFEFKHNWLGNFIILCN